MKSPEFWACMVVPSITFFTALVYLVRRDARKLATLDIQSQPPRFQEDEPTGELRVSLQALSDLESQQAGGITIYPVDSPLR